MNKKLAGKTFQITPVGYFGLNVTIWEPSKIL